MNSKIRVDFSDFWHANTLAAKRENPIFRLLSKRFDLEICEQPDFVIYSCFGLDYLRHRGTRIFYTGENRRANFDLCDWAFGFDYTDHPRYFRWPYYALYDLTQLTAPRDSLALSRQKTKFCAFVYSNGFARERLRFLDKLSRYKVVDCGGRVRNNLGYFVGDKIEFLQAYKFSIAFENSCHAGYTSEKLPQAMLGNTVPIYWGNPLVKADFNSDAFVNCHDFSNLDQAVEFVVELDRNDELYRRYLGAPPFNGGIPTPHVDETRVLDRFETIFSTPLETPVARTSRGRIAGLLREPKRIRTQIRRRLVAAS